MLVSLLELGRLQSLVTWRHDCMKIDMTVSGACVFLRV